MEHLKINVEENKPLICSNTFTPSLINSENIANLMERSLNSSYLNKKKSSSSSQNNKYDDDIFDISLNKDILIQILDSTPNGIQIVDTEGIIQYVNPAFLNIVNVKLEERVGKSIFEVSPDGSLSSVLKAGQPVANIMNQPSGTHVELVSSAAPIYYNNKMIGAIAAVNDIRSIFTLAEQLRNTRNMVENLSEKLSNLSSATYTFSSLIARCPSMLEVVEAAKIASQNDTTVLIQGETGTGKEVVANSIHSASRRSNKPFISINCSAIPKELLESEFFGHEKGAFTGAYKRKLGKFELANEGTLFLDEIGDMDLSLQAKILRAIQEKEIQRVGSETKIKVDVRIIAATNRDLINMVDTGEFRRDLFYRLNIWNINIPPLRRRKEDLEELTNFLTKKVCRRLGKKETVFSPQAIEIIHNYEWPGNIRELENIIERTVISLKDRNLVYGDDLKYLISSKNTNLDNTCDEIMPLEKVEERIIRRAIKKFGFSYEGKKQISEALGISLATLYNKINKYRLMKEDIENK
jgi:PAS domain S-box-containing protein